MQMDDIKLFVKNTKEVEILKQAVKIYSNNRRMEFELESVPGKNKKNSWQCTRDDVDRLYVSRKEGTRELASS